MNNYTETNSSTEPPPIHGDILDAILSHIPLIHLIPLSHVSKAWTASVSSTFRTSTNPKPWLVLHTQSSRHSYQYQCPYPSTHAYDPDSNKWIRIHTRSPTTNHITTLRSSHSNLLYTLSPTNFSFSFDPLHLTWHHVSAPKVSRLDPIVAVVGRRVVVAGGAYDFENDPLAVEIYDLQSHTWIKSDPMPRIFSFNHSASSIWLSVASDDPNLFVMEKSSGMTYSFDTSTNTWSGPYDLRPDRNVYHSVIGKLTGRLIVIGVLGEAEDVTGVKVWEVDCESFGLKAIGEMPVDIVEDLRRCDEVISSIDVVMGGNVVYMCVGERDGEVVVCEVGDKGGCRWRKVVNTVGECGVMDRVVLTCSVVGVEDLQRAVRVEDWKFVVKR
ncbi:putative kelch-type beta propeller [Helianthus annuus]|uniref:Kelch-type beta propeller n=1 Tax=Helianthus annuus TaxID=4232 RepID=A0A251UGY1_HELAN|nr:F-box/kelch-repeat protein At1g23390 [Helianthus annuus]KAF5801878.1 putative kelch-type beta propeller [Helianthus annuus]KAJ0560118.1 putative kelch-type beta propeller [Helianthus annuus]KAJ0573115.1 putative kelch-type beta propeller [Helianthus annuus]KAJ0740410.1 putative kelch-type beta propeller [Helianthus annuus]